MYLRSFVQIGNESEDAAVDYFALDLRELPLHLVL